VGGKCIRFKIRISAFMKAFENSIFNAAIPHDIPGATNHILDLCPLEVIFRPDIPGETGQWFEELLFRLGLQDVSWYFDRWLFGDQAFGRFRKVRLPK
jgi:hypothetical protein